jgi:histone deacetylase 6
VAVAATYAREKLGMKKILIVDWDVHHGNGTQKCFYENHNVLCFSVHRHHGGNFYPFMQHGGAKSVGKGPGEGFNINVGWDENGMGDDEYLVVWEKLLMPVAEEFNPDFVIVSAGFDAARGDVGECSVTPKCFARLTRRLKMLAGGKIVLSLEGGYVRRVLCESIASVLEALLDTNSTPRCRNELVVFHTKLRGKDMLDCICPSAARSIRDTIAVHSKYWNCLKSDCRVSKSSRETSDSGDPAELLNLSDNCNWCS